MVLHYLRRFLRWQLYGLFQHLDPIAQKGEPESAAPTPTEPGSTKWNLYFIVPFLIIALSAIHGNLFLPFAVSGVPFSWLSLSTSPALLYRQIYPPAMWPQADIALFSAVLAVLILFASFWRHPWTLHRYVNVATWEAPILRIGTCTLSTDTSLAILYLHGRIRKCTIIVLVGCAIIVYLFIYGNIYLNGYYSMRNGHFLFSLFILLPNFINAAIYALFGITIFIIFACVFTQIRQKDVLLQMRSLNDHLAKLKDRKPGRLKRKLAFFWLASRLLNRTVLAICREQEAYATYWTTVLSLYFLNHTTLQTYLVYSVFFTDGIVFLQKIAFIYLVLLIDLALFLLINLCARVGTLNRRIERLNGSFYLLMAQRKAFELKGISQQLKCESLATNHRLRPYAFHLFDNYRITSRTFYMVFSNIALYFFLIFKRAHHQ